MVDDSSFNSLIESEFQLLKREVNGKRLVYLDNAAMLLKPISVISEVSKFYNEFCSNVYRSGHSMGSEVTELVESVRCSVKRFLNAGSEYGVIFTSGSTEASNLIAYGLKDFFVNGEIILTDMEHSSNLVPWLRFSKESNLSVKFWKYDRDFRLDLSDLCSLLSKDTKVLALTYVSNVLGSVNDVSKIVRFVKERFPEIIVVIDGAQAVPHFKVNLDLIGADFFYFSGYKIGAPTGIGVLVGKRGLLERLSPLKLGGGSVLDIDYGSYTLSDVPYRLEAGTLNIEGILGLKSAISLFLDKFRYDYIVDVESSLCEYFLKSVDDFKRVSDFNFRLIGSNFSELRVPIFSFYFEGLPLHDVSSILDEFGIACRSGEHCAFLIHKRERICGSVRFSLSFFNSKEDIDYLFSVLKRLRVLFESGMSI